MKRVAAFTLTWLLGASLAVAQPSVTEGDAAKAKANGLTREGGRAYLRRVDVVGGTIARVDVDLRFSAPSPSSAAAMAAPPAIAGEISAAPPAAVPPTWTWRQKLGIPLMVAGPVLIGAGVYFGVRARGEANDIASDCKQSCAGRDMFSADRARRRYGTAQWILLGSGAGALVTGAALFLMGGSDRPHEGARFSLAFPAGGVAAQVGGTF